MSAPLLDRAGLGLRQDLLQNLFERLDQTAENAVQI